MVDAPDQGSSSPSRSSQVRDGCPPTVLEATQRADGSLRKQVRIKAGFASLELAEPRDPFRSARVKEAKDRGENGKRMPSPTGSVLGPGEGRKTHVIADTGPPRWVLRDAEDEEEGGPDVAKETELEAKLDKLSL